ncbi:MAG: tRNA pseudouridine(38-40) synthase TruA [Clostridia bacterium]|nr:tRNA pseudouridine(38-40) synthase TruA [Clostridia bacterium]
MRQILLKLKYIGTAYHGWQVQENAVSVQQTLQDAVEAIFGERLDVTGCSRTDAGVHANMYCCTIRTDSDIDCFRLMGALNAKLPDDISVFACEDVPEDFHPRYSATAKQYIYRINNAKAPDPFLEGRALHYKTPIDEVKLNKAAQAFVGTHDFTGFCGAKSDIEDCTRTVYEASVTRDGDVVTFSVTGDGFLYNMVRIMVGTLLFVNEGKIDADDIPRIIENKDRKAAGKTAPACGLYLNKVFYGGETIG